MSKKELEDLTNSEKDYVCHRCVPPTLNIQSPGPQPGAQAQPDKKRKPNIEPPTDRIPKKPKV